MNFNSGETASSVMPFIKLAISRAPKSTPSTLPRPPRRLVPPTTHAAIASSSIRSPTVVVEAPAVRGLEKTGQRHDAAHAREGPGDHPGDRHAGHEGGGFVSADRVEMPAEHGVAGQNMDGQRNDGENQGGQGHPPELGGEEHEEKDGLGGGEQFEEGDSLRSQPRNPSRARLRRSRNLAPDQKHGWPAPAIASAGPGGR
jgi:hypothetical protein